MTRAGSGVKARPGSPHYIDSESTTPDSISNLVDLEGRIRVGLRPRIRGPDPVECAGAGLEAVGGCVVEDPPPLPGGEVRRGGGGSSQVVGLGRLRREGETLAEDVEPLAGAIGREAGAAVDRHYDVLHPSEPIERSRASNESLEENRIDVVPGHQHGDPSPVHRVGTVAVTTCASNLSVGRKPF